MEEVWKYIYIDKEQTKYQVSNFGKVKNSVTNKILKPQKNKHGYSIVGIYHNNKRNTKVVHRLVALSFLYTDKNKHLEVNHIDGNKNNNSLVNLELVTRKENMQHGFLTGLIPFTPVKNKANNYKGLSTSEKRDLILTELMILNNYNLKQAIKFIKSYNLSYRAEKKLINRVQEYYYIEGAE